MNPGPLRGRRHGRTSLLFTSIMSDCLAFMGLVRVFSRNVTYVGSYNSISRSSPTHSYLPHSSYALFLSSLLPSGFPIPLIFLFYFMCIKYLVLSGVNFTCIFVIYYYYHFQITSRISLHFSSSEELFGTTILRATSMDGY